MLWQKPLLKYTVIQICLNVHTICLFFFKLIIRRFTRFGLNYFLFPDLLSSFVYNLESLIELYQFWNAFYFWLLMWISRNFTKTVIILFSCINSKKSNIIYFKKAFAVAAHCFAFSGPPLLRGRSWSFRPMGALHVTRAQLDSGSERPRGFESCKDTYTSISSIYLDNQVKRNDLLKENVYCSGVYTYIFARTGWRHSSAR